MAVNRYFDHLVVIVEDDANRQLAVGFLLSSRVQANRVQLKPVARGWSKAANALSEFAETSLRKYPKARVLVLVDYDNDLEGRAMRVLAGVPDDLKSRCYIAGCAEEPERLRASLGISLEKIGTKLADSWGEEERGVWSHDQLAHNAGVMKKLIEDTSEFLCVGS